MLEGLRNALENLLVEDQLFSPSDSFEEEEERRATDLGMSASRIYFFTA